MEYRHTQTGPLHFILYATVCVMLVAAWFTRNEPAVVPLMFAAFATLTLVLTFCFKSLTVQDEGEELAIRYGPIPLFSKTIPYAQITAVEPDRTKLVDGWGIHWVPLRGWTYNLWGYDCVKLTLGRKVLRIGTDDREGLLTFLRDKIEPHSAGSSRT